MDEEFSPELLRAKRKAAGMTQDSLSELSGVPSSTISKYELGKYAPQRDIWSNLLKGLRGIRVRHSKNQDTWQDYKPTPQQPPPSFSFELGHVYSIRDNNSGWRSDGINPQYGTMCKFKYEGKRGVHHCFREVRGGWTRTYTDAQLIGKIIKEEG